MGKIVGKKRIARLKVLLKHRGVSSRKVFIQLDRIAALPCHGRFSFLHHGLEEEDSIDLPARLSYICEEKPEQTLYERLYCIRFLAKDRTYRDAIPHYRRHVSFSRFGRVFVKGTRDT